MRLKNIHFYCYSLERVYKLFKNNKQNCKKKECGSANIFNLLLTINLYYLTPKINHEISLILLQIK